MGRMRNGCNDLRNFCHDILFKKRYLVGIQIGSFEGESAEIFLQSLAFDKLYCVDAWTNGYDQNDWASNICENAEKQFDKKFQYEDRIIKVKGFSYNVVDQFQDKSIDFIYIDGNHSYEGVKKDLQLYMPKLKDGGIVSGHDFYYEQEFCPEQLKGVKKAVLQYFNRIPLKIYKDTSWYYYNTPESHYQLCKLSDYKYEKDNKKIGIVTLYNDACRLYGSLSDQTKQQYCKRQGYDYIKYDKVLYEDKHPYWSKMPALLNNFDKYDYLVWMDADAIIANYDFDVASLFDDKHSIYISKDRLGINNGIFAVKCNDIAKQFLNDVMEHYDEFCDHGCPQQDDMSYLIYNKYMKDNLFVAPRYWNSYDDCGAYEVFNPYQYGDFVLHLPNQPRLNCIHGDYRRWRFIQILMDLNDKYSNEIDNDKKIIQKKYDSMVFCTCSEINYKLDLAKIDIWFQYIKNMNVDFYVFVDGYIPEYEINKRKHLNFICCGNKLGLHNSRNPGVCLHDYAGWKRSICKAIQIGRDYKYILHVENDVIVFNPKKLQELMKSGRNVSGFVAGGDYMQTAIMTLNDKKANEQIIDYYINKGNLYNNQVVESRFQQFCKYDFQFVGDRFGIIDYDMSFDKKVKELKRLNVDYWAQFYSYEFNFKNGKFIIRKKII